MLLMKSNAEYDSYIIKLGKDRKSEREFYTILYNDARKLIRKQKLSKISYEDVASESVIKVLKKLGKYQIGTNFKAWFSRIIFNSYKDEYRKIKRYNAIPLYTKNKEGEEMNILDLEVFENPKNLESLTLSEETKTALNKLDASHKMALMLAYVYGMKYEEIAKIMDIPLGTVRSKLSRGKKLFKRKFKLEKENSQKLYKPQTTF